MARRLPVFTEEIHSGLHPLWRIIGSFKKRLHMKLSKPLIVSMCLFFVLSSKAQVNTGNKSYPDLSPNHRSDSMDILAFKRLLIFITTGSNKTKKSDINLDSLKKVSETHFLYTPVPASPGQYTQDNSSYDNFLPTVYHKDVLQGSPFFLTAYVSGLVVNQKDSIIDNPDFLYNYDKVSANLLLKKGNASPIAVNKDQVKYFCLKLDQGGYIFEHVSLINPNEYFQVLYKGSKYSFYKQIKSEFVGANQKTNGYVREGNDYDEYHDVFTYYIVDRKKGEPIAFELSRKSLRKSLYAESDIVEQFFKNHKWEKVDDTFVVYLAERVNRQ